MIKYMSLEKGPVPKESFESKNKGGEQLTKEQIEDLAGFFDISTGDKLPEEIEKEIDLKAKDFLNGMSLPKGMRLDILNDPL